MESLKAENAGKSGAAMAAPFIISFVADLIMAGMLGGIMVISASTRVRAGVISGALFWVGFVLTTLVVNNAYAFRKVALIVIDGGHWLGVLLLMGAIIGGLGPDRRRGAPNPRPKWGIPRLVGCARAVA